MTKQLSENSRIMVSKLKFLGFNLDNLLQTQIEHLTGEEREKRKRIIDMFDSIVETFNFL